MLRALTIVSAMLIGSPSLAQANNPVSLDSSVLVERTSTDASGKTQLVLEEPRVVVPGDKLVFVLRYQNNGRAPASDLIVTNPLPQAVAYQTSDDNRVQVSVDGGRSWGQLAAMTVRDGDGTSRAARAEEVTHLRWAFTQPIPAGEAGRLMFRGIVR